MSVQKIAVDRTVILLTNMGVPFRIEFGGGVFTNIVPPAAPEKPKKTIRYGYFDFTNYKAIVDGMELGKEVVFTRSVFADKFPDTQQGEDDWGSFVACIKSRAQLKWKKENVAMAGGVRDDNITMMRVA